MSQRKPQPIHPFITFLVNQWDKIVESYNAGYYITSLRVSKTLLISLKSADRKGNPQIMETIDAVLSRVKMVSGFNWNQVYSRKIQLSHELGPLAAEVMESISEILYTGNYLLPSTWGADPTAKDNVSGREVRDPIARILSSRLE